MAIMNPPTSSKFVLDMYFAATAEDDMSPSEGNRMYGSKAVTGIGSTSKIQKRAIMIKQYLCTEFYPAKSL